MISVTQDDGTEEVMIEIWLHEQLGMKMHVQPICKDTKKFLQE
jgi:hypothetical protein